MIIYL